MADIQTKPSWLIEQNWTEFNWGGGNSWFNNFLGVVRVEGWWVTQTFTQGKKNRWNFFSWFNNETGFTTAYRDVSCMKGKRNAYKSLFLPCFFRNISFTYTFLEFLGSDLVIYKEQLKNGLKKTSKITMWLYKIFFFLLVHIFFSFTFVRSSTCVLLHTHFIMLLLKLEIAFLHSIKILHSQNTPTASINIIINNFIIYVITTLWDSDSVC